MATVTCSYQICAIRPDVVASLQVLDDAGRPPRIIIDAEGGSPLRCCLRHSLPGETIALVSYAPLRRWALDRGADPGPYDELGPVFIHLHDCPGYVGTGYPDEFRGSRRMLRVYRGDGSILGGRLIEPADSAEANLAALFADPEVAIVHARAVEFGCFTFEVRRAG